MKKCDGYMKFVRDEVTKEWLKIYYKCDKCGREIEIEVYLKSFNFEP